MVMLVFYSCIFGTQITKQHGCNKRKIVYEMLRVY